MTETFHSILAPGSRLDPAHAARVLGPLVELSSLDLVTGLRYGAGWVLRRVTAERAAVVEACARDQLGVDLLRIPDDVPLEPPSLRRVRGVVFDEERVHLEFVEGDESYRYPELAALAITIQGHERLADEESEIRDFGSLVAANREWIRHREALADPAYVVREAAIELVLAEPIEFLRCELGTPFPELALDGELNTIDNWLRFAFHVRDRAPGAVLPRAEAFLDSADRAAVQFEKREELENYRMWIAELIARGHWRSV